MSRSRKKNEWLSQVTILLAGGWIAFVIALEVVGAALPDWLSRTSPAPGNVAASDPGESPPDGCVLMPGDIEICDEMEP